jgi:hypothetical protein
MPWGGQKEHLVLKGVRSMASHGRTVGPIFIVYFVPSSVVIVGRVFFSGQSDGVEAREIGQGATICVKPLSFFDRSSREAGYDVTFEDQHEHHQREGHHY